MYNKVSFSFISILYQRDKIETRGFFGSLFLFKFIYHSGLEGWLSKTKDYVKDKPNNIQ